MDAGRTGFVTGGTWCADHNRLVEAWPAEDGIAEILSVVLGGGGSACNLALCIRRLDPAMPVETIGVVGDDADGRFLLGEADANGVERSQLIMAPGAATQSTEAYSSRASGRRVHLFLRGAADLLSPVHFDFAPTRGRVLHLGLPGIHQVMDAPWRGEANGWVAVLKAARAAGLLTSLELVSLPAKRLAPIVRPCLPHLDYLIVNDHEIGALAGEATVGEGGTDAAACARAVRAVAAMGPMRLVAVHFPAGAFALTGEGTAITQPSLRVPPEEIVAANGAGDAFAAGTLYALHQGWPADEALRLGRAAAATSLRHVSTTAGVPTWQECLRLAGEWGERPMPRFG